MSDPLEEALAPILNSITERALVTDRFIDRDIYRLSVATLWSNLVMDPAGSGIDDNDLESVHNIVSRACNEQLGGEDGLLGVFHWINSKAGDTAMNSAHLQPEHADMLRYFASMMIDPERHRQWMDELREQQQNS
ncbi:MAG: hypothetical protein NXH85_07535 [Pseudomonadaceae bacterium]|nr:hypothetical protein [Pseudomonadaceae bacterium]